MYQSDKTDISKKRAVANDFQTQIIRQRLTLPQKRKPKIDHNAHRFPRENGFYVVFTTEEYTVNNGQKGVGRQAQKEG